MPEFITSLLGPVVTQRLYLVTLIFKLPTYFLSMY